MVPQRTPHVDRRHVFTGLKDLARHVVCRIDRAAEDRSHVVDLIEFESRVNDVWCRQDDAVICTCAPDGTPDFVNSSWLDYIGQTLACVRSHPEACMSAVHPDDLDRAARVYWSGIGWGQGYTFEARFHRIRDGVYRWHLNRAVILHDAEGKVLSFVGTSTDIENLKQSEENLRQGRCARAVY
jgi:PAS domain S-box-containing protein